jgi:adenylate cyclase
MLDESDKASDSSSGSSEPSPAEVRAQLRRILGSQCFAQAARSSKFLEHVVEQTLAGHGERLKGYSIAVEVFGRPTDFDAQTDPLVRVEAGRLRRRLAEYYSGEGQGDPVLIGLPRGGYAATWAYSARERDVAKQVEAEGVGAATPRVPARALAKKRWRRVRALLVAAVILAALTVILVQQREQSLTRDYPTLVEAVERGGRLPIVVLPFDDLTTGDKSTALADALTEETLLELDEHDLFVIATEPRGRALAPDTARFPEASRYAYVLSGSVRRTPDEVRITARLVVAATGTQIWSASFDEPASIVTLTAEQERVARAIATVAAPYGPVFEAELARLAAAPPKQLGARECLLKYYEYRRVLAVAQYGDALQCFEQVTEREPALADAWAGLAMLLLDAHGYGYSLPAVESPLEQAREAARRALDVDGASVLGSLALARVQFFSRAEFVRTAEQALTLRPNNAEALAMVGSMHVLAGSAARGTELLEHAIALSPRVPGNYHASLALGQLRLGRYDDALASALRIDSPDWPMGLVVVTATAALAGRDDIAVRSRQRLLEISGGGQTLATTFERWPTEPALRSEIARGLQLAGMTPR